MKSLTEEAPNFYEINFLIATRVTKEDFCELAQ